AASGSRGVRGVDHRTKERAVRAVLLSGWLGVPAIRAPGEKAQAIILVAAMGLVCDCHGTVLAGAPQQDSDLHISRGGAACEVVENRPPRVARCAADDSVPCARHLDGPADRMDGTNPRLGWEGFLRLLVAGALADRRARRLVLRGKAGVADGTDVLLSP